MYLFAQHGWAKSTRIETGLRAGIIHGVILSPRYETSPKLELFARQLRAEFGDKSITIFDPQFFVSALLDPRVGKLSSYPYFHAGLTRTDFKPSQVKTYVKETLDYQTALPVDRLVTPSVFIEDVSSGWTQIALNLARESQLAVQSAGLLGKLLVSVVLDENVLKHRDSVDELLEEMTTWDSRGFLITVRLADTRYPALLSEVQLINLMYLIYVLADRNNYEVICTHSDFPGLLLHAVGAFATSTGWHNTLRQFSFKAFEPSKRGGQSRSRYTSASLLNAILVIPELSSIVARGLGPRVIAGTPYDSDIARDPGNAAWTADQACLHHWAALSRLLDEIAAQGSVQDKLNLLEQWIADGIALYRTIESSGIAFEETTGSRNLIQWQRAVENFKKEEVRP